MCMANHSNYLIPCWNLLFAASPASPASPSLQVGIQWDVPGVLGEAIREFLDVGLHHRYTLEGHTPGGSSAPHLQPRTSSITSSIRFCPNLSPSIFFCRGLFSSLIPRLSNLFADWRRCKGCEGRCQSRMLGFSPASFMEL